MQRMTTILLLAVLTGAVPGLAHGPEQVSFTTEDGVEIVGSYHGPERCALAPVVILLHMYGSDRSAWDPIIEVLHEHGVAVLAIDLRGHGQSIQPTSMGLQEQAATRDEELFRSMYRDVMAAYAWLSDQPNVDSSQFGLVGASVGCSVAIDYAARDRSVDVVVCMTPGEDYLGVDSRKHIAEFAKHGQRPILLLATEAERKACDALGEIDKFATLGIVGQGKVHGTGMFGKIRGIEEQIADFLVEHLGDAAERPVVAVVDGDEYFDIGSKLDINLQRGQRRLFSSAKEAESRGLKRASGIEANRIDDRPIRSRRTIPW
ncbi:MAG: alpha/beta hydrolase, partial [Planctomycetota bacterium]